MQPVNSSSLDEAAAELQAMGFVQISAMQWKHTAFDVGPYRIPLSVKFDEAFPRALPTVIVERQSLPRRLPHVESSGKICIGPSSGVLIDHTRPRQLVHDVLRLASAVLAESNSDTIERELYREFLAYWESKAKGLIYVDIDPLAPSRPVLLGHSPRAPSRLIAAEDKTRLERWCRSLGLKEVVQGRAYVMRLDRGFVPPDYDKQLSSQTLLEIIETRVNQTDFTSLWSWLEHEQLPATIILSLPGSEPTDRIIASAQIPFPWCPEHDKKFRKFRPGRFPRDWALKLALPFAIEVLGTQRVDSGFLVTRSGGDPSFASSTIAVLGVGSLGSHLATALASAGTGELRLIDPDVLTANNIYRHSLGASYIGAHKTKALANRLQIDFPSLRVQTREVPAETVLHTEPHWLLDCDMIAVAMGEETTELLLNEMLPPCLHRLHVWVEPLGLGGHVLAIPRDSSKGCYECLFGRLDDGRFANMASLAQPGQSFQRSLAGCAGTYTPFGDLDARNAAITAARTAGNLLSGQIKSPTLISWVGNTQSFLNNGFRLSSRGQYLVNRMSGETFQDFARPDCPVCGARPA